MFYKICIFFHVVFHARETSEIINCLFFLERCGVIICSQFLFTENASDEYCIVYLITGCVEKLIGNSHTLIRHRQL
jgi:hypothetical protein